MSVKLMDGNAIASEIRIQIASEIRKLKDKGVYPGLAVVLVGGNPASISYVNAKEKDCQMVGIDSRDIRLSEQVSEKELLNLIEQLNIDPTIHGILVQLPLPDHIDDEKVIESISPQKDVDGFHPVNMGKLVLGSPSYIPCTPHGVLKMLEYYKVTTDGAHAVVIGRSRIVGLPLANVLALKKPTGNATVTLCHSKTTNLADLVRNADIIVAAIGKPGFVSADMVKDNAVVIDVGINRIADSTRKSGYKLVGDVDFDEVQNIARLITPVPGGVGPLTRAMLLWNTLQAATMQAF